MTWPRLHVVAAAAVEQESTGLDETQPRVGLAPELQQNSELERYSAVFAKFEPAMLFLHVLWLQPQCR